MGICIVKGVNSMKKYYEVIQEENSDCGISSLLSIIRYYKGNIPLETLRMETNTSSLGTNAYELVKYAKSIGFNSWGLRVDTINNNLPVIAHLKYSSGLYHFVVVYKIIKDYIIIMDPAIGFKKIKQDEFYKLFTGNIICFKPVGVIPKLNNNKCLNNIIKKYARDHIKKIFLIVTLSILLIVFSIVDSFDIKILDINNKLIFLLVFCTFLKNIIDYIKNISVIKYSNKFNKKIINVFFSHIFKLPLNYLKLKQKGELVARFNELNELSKNIFNYVIDLLINVIMLIIISFIICGIDYRLFFIMCPVCLLFIYFNKIIHKKLINKINYSINLEESYISNIVDYITKYESVIHAKSFNYFSDNINENLDNVNNMNIDISKKVCFINSLNEIIISFINIISLYFILDNNFNIINGILIIMIINYFINIIKKLVSYYPSLILFKRIINKNNDLLSLKVSDKKIIKDKVNTISINNLSYRINDNVIINNLSYVIKSNDKIFLKGPSGIGKSTLLKILNNEIINYEGKIKINNYNMRDINLDNILSYGSQDEELFNDTLINNITLGKKYVKSELDNILEICKIYNIKIVRDVGLNSYIINNNSLSGGEKNRVILARILLNSKMIIVLDEILKETDYDLEVDVVKNILNYYKDRIIIYVSHKDLEFLFSKVLTFRKE